MKFETLITILTIDAIFDNWKDSPGDLTFETLITILTIENLNSDNHSFLTINCDTEQHSQFLRCFRNASLRVVRGVKTTTGAGRITRITLFFSLATW